MVLDIRLNLLRSPLVFLGPAVVAPLNADLAVYGWLLIVPVYIFRCFREHALKEG